MAIDLCHDLVQPILSTSEELTNIIHILPKNNGAVIVSVRGTTVKETRGGK